LLIAKVELDGDSTGPWTEEVADELHRDLRKYLPDALAEAQQADGKKGLAEELITFGITLVSSGTAAELVRLLRDWVNRAPARRSVVISAGEKEIRVSGENVDDAAIAAALNVAAKVAD
jgi:hypothetical protein